MIFEGDFVFVFKKTNFGECAEPLEKTMTTLRTHSDLHRVEEIVWNFAQTLSFRFHGHQEKS